MQLKAGFHNTVGGVIRMVVLLATIPLLIWLLGVAEYGLWALVSAVVGVLALAEGGLAVSTTVFAARDLARKDAAGLSQTLTVTFGVMAALATLAAAAIWLGAGFVSERFPKLDAGQRETAAAALRFSAVVLWTRLLQQVCVGVEQACQRYGLLNVVNTTQQVFANIGMLVVAGLGGGIVALMKWQALVSAAGLCVHGAIAWKLLRPWQPRLQWDRRKACEIVRYSGLAWVSLLGSVLFSQCDRLVVGWVLSPELLGVYAAMTGVAIQINALSALSAQPLVPYIAGVRGTEGLEGPAVWRQIRQTLELNLLIALGLGLGLFLLAPWVVKMLLPELTSSQNVLAFRIAVVVYSLYSVNATGYYLLHGLQAMKVCVLVQFTTGLLTLALIAVGATFGGLRGAVLGGAGYLGVWLLTVLAMKRIHVVARDWLGAMGFYLVCFAVVLTVGALGPGFLAVQAGGAVLGALALAGGFVLRNQDQFGWRIGLPSR